MREFVKAKIESLVASQQLHNSVNCRKGLCFFCYFPVGISAKQQSEGVRFFIFPTDCFFGDFAHWVVVILFFTK